MSERPQPDETLEAYINRRLHEIIARRHQEYIDSLLCGPAAPGQTTFFGQLRGIRDLLDEANAEQP